MASPRIEYAVLPAGDGPGQDRCFTADGLVVVLDGASTIDPVANPDATEYVDTLGPVLIEQIIDTPGIDLRDALAEAIRQTAEKLTLVSGTAPSSTVSIVRWGDETVDVLVLGDSPVAIHFTDGSHETIVQHPQDHIAPELRRRYRERLKAGHGFDAEHRSILASIQRREAPLRNQPLGYFIAEAEPIASAHSLVSSYPTVDVLMVRIATDGADAVSGQLPLRPSTSEELLASLRELHMWELRENPAGSVRPRSKLHDDKAIADMLRRP